MSIELGSAEDLFNLLAGDDEEVPSCLIRGNKVSRHEETIKEQAEMARLNKVEVWIQTEDSVLSDVAGFLSVGTTLVVSVLEACENSLSGNIVQKLTKMIIIWLKATKSCRLVESAISAPETVTILDMCFLKLSKYHGKAAFEACMRFVSAMITIKPDPLILECCNKHIARWSKVKRISEILTALPVEVTSKLHYASTQKERVDSQILVFVDKLLKKKLSPAVDYPSFIRTCKSKDAEIQLLKTIAAGCRGGKTPLSAETKDWVETVATRDAKKPGVSTKPILLAKQLLED